jgi:hypothetical protein
LLPSVVITSKQGESIVGRRGMHEKWMKLINHVWATVFYRELARQYLADQPLEPFFLLMWYAVKDKLLMGIAHAVTLCVQIAKQIDIGPEGKKALAELKELYAKGDLEDRLASDFDDCGVKVFRDKVIAHPANKVKEIQGKDPYKVSVKWETVDATIEKIREFCQAVERHNADHWKNTSSYLGETGDGASALKLILSQMEEARKYHKLRSEVAQAGRPRIWYDWNSKEFIVENE